LGSASAQGAASEFFAAARGALQNQLGLRWNLPAQTITLADINARMNGEAEGFRFVFERSSCRLSTCIYTRMGCDGVL
jgi:hypothetical protein